MAEQARLSELAGIAEDSDYVKSFWPINIALVALGAAILGTAFFFLSSDDERLLFNPWTYAVVTPIALLALSTILSTLVSRLIEKSMQLALLMSILIHLVLLIYAVNIVIFSRAWPDVLESLARQRHQLQRETLHANQYHRMASTTPNSKKPDYLRHVPTQHEATEVATTESPALQLTRSETADLVSPTPDVEKSVTAHLLDRSQASNTRPAPSEQLASLSRSDLSRELDANILADSSRPAPFDTSPPPELAPNDAQRRRTASTSSEALAQPSAPGATLQPSRQSLARNRRGQPTPTQQRAADLAKSSNQEPSPLQRQRIDSPQLPSAISSPKDLVAMDSAASVRRSSTTSSGGPAPAADASLPQPTSSAALQRRAQAFEQPKATDFAGNSRSIPRASAGGITGPSAPNSMPVQGIEPSASASAAGDTVASTPLAANRLTPNRRSRSGNSAGGAPAAPQWQGSPSLGSGSSGLAPAAMTRNQRDGSAASSDTAGLTGNERAIARSSLGASGSPQSPDTMAVPAESSVGSSGSSSESNTTELAASETRTQRRGARESLRSSTSLDSRSMDTSSAESPSLAGRSLGNMKRASELGTTSDSSARSPQEQVARSQVGGSAPDSSEIDIPQFDTIELASSASTQLPGSLDAARLQPRQTRPGSTSATPLDIEAPEGQGGVASLLNQSGPLLARRSDRVEEPTPQQIDAQRFSRKEIGGPLAGGQRASVPTPAFQQRIDRIKDRNAQGETNAQPQTELAIERGLAFLARTQRDDGSWRLQDYDTKLLLRSDTAATALALLAFQGAGYTHKQFKHSETVGKALNFLISHQEKNGDLYIRQDPASDQNAWLYSHGIAALALCEAYGMTQDPKLRGPAQGAIDFMRTSQDPRRGGWRYHPKVGSDTSVTGWFMMAFKSGQLAGLDVRPETFQQIQDYVQASQASPDEPHLYRYNPYAADTPQQRHGLKPTAVMTSVGLLMRLYLGWNRDNPNMVAGSDHLLNHLPRHGSPENSARDTYYWYYATQVMFHMRGYHWKRWHEQLYPLLINNQVTQGEYEGSWDPISPTPDLWARYGGRLYVTTMNLLSLEVSYRHLPLYEATAQ